MNYTPSNKFPADKVRICKKDVCVEARGKNAELLVTALSFAFICWGIATLAKAS